MKHVTEIVGYQKLSNGEVAVTIRCCGDPATDRRHTMALAVLADAGRRKESLDLAHAATAQEHQIKLDAAVAVPDLLGETREHDD